LKPFRLLAVGLAFCLAAFLGLVSFFAGSTGIAQAQSSTWGSSTGVCSTDGMTYADGYGVAQHLDAAQTAIIAAFMKTAAQLKVSDQATVILIATGLQESGLHNYTNPRVPASSDYPNDGAPPSGGDHLSIGPLQQQVGMGWGTVAQLMQPTWQARQFLTRLLEVPRWQQLTETVAAQAVQRSAFGDAYQKWVDSARNILGAAKAVTCGDPDGASTGGRQTVVTAALHYVGTPYSWAGGDRTGPTFGVCAEGAAANDCHIKGFDCSGLALYAYAKLGLSLPHYAAAQYDAGPHLDRDQLLPGDLVFLAADLSQPSTIHHVAIWIGDDSIVQAPESGQKLDVVHHPFDQAWFASQYIGATRPTLPGVPA
jgi:cell wall-associated NlpC family hydrolase